MTFRRAGAQKWDPPGPPLILRRPPRGAKIVPEKVRAGPPDPNGAPGTSSRAPGTLCTLLVCGGSCAFEGNALGTHSGSISVTELGGTKPPNHEKIVTNPENHD